MITKDNKDLPILEITAENYLVPKGEETLYHIRMEVKEFDRNSGERLSHPFIQKFSLSEIENGTMSLLRQQGYAMEILHDPKEWLKAKSESAAKAEAEKKAAEKAAEKEALRQEILKEMEAEKKAETEKKAADKKANKEKKEETEVPDLM